MINMAEKHEVDNLSHGGDPIFLWSIRGKIAISECTALDSVRFTTAVVATVPYQMNLIKSAN
jgi:hypothetical protein